MNSIEKLDNNDEILNKDSARFSVTMILIS
jgi:hypothetical protein